MAKGWDIRRVYLYLVSFTTLIMVIIGTVMIINNLVDLVYPEKNSYGAYPKTEYPGRYQEMKKINPELTYEQFQKDIEAEKKEAAKTQRVWQIRNFIKSLALIIVALPAYLYHWRKIQRSESLPPAGPGDPNSPVS